MMFIPSLFLPATSITALRSAAPKDGYSPVVPKTTTPSAPLCLNQARTSLKAAGSNFKFLSQGVQLATQNMVLDLLPRLRGALCAMAGPLNAAAAAAPPINPIAPLRVVSINRSSAAFYVYPAYTEKHETPPLFSRGGALWKQNILLNQYLTRTPRRKLRPIAS